MFKKLLGKVLGIEKLEKEIERLNDSIQAKEKYLQHQIDNVQEENRSLKNLINIGVDVHLNQREINWAVVCINRGSNGLNPIVKFIELPNDAKYIYDFIVQFDGIEKKVDAPPYVLQMWRKKNGGKL